MKLWFILGVSTCNTHELNKELWVNTIEPPTTATKKWKSSQVLTTRKTRVYLGVKTCELFLCLGVIICVLYIVSGLFVVLLVLYVTGEFHRFLHRGWAENPKLCMSFSPAVTAAVCNRCCGVFCCNALK